MVLLILWILIIGAVILLANKASRDYDFTVPMIISVLIMIGVVFTFAWVLRGCIG
jgi:hypothetical protein